MTTSGYSLRQVMTALANLQWILRNRDDVQFCPDSETLAYGDGGVDVWTLFDPDFTPDGRWWVS